MEIGAQLYTVREHTKTLEDFSQTLEKIAEEKAGRNPDDGRREE